MVKQELIVVRAEGEGHFSRCAQAAAAASFCVGSEPSWRVGCHRNRDETAHPRAFIKRSEME